MSLSVYTHTTIALQAFRKTGAPWDVGSSTNFTVVVTSGDGGTGFVALQMAKFSYNASTVVTAGSSGECSAVCAEFESTVTVFWLTPTWHVCTDHFAFLKQMGADHVVDYHQQDVFDALPDDSVDIVYDNYGAPGTADKAMSKLRQGGVFIFLPGKGGARTRARTRARTWMCALPHLQPHPMTLPCVHLHQALCPSTPKQE